MVKMRGLITPASKETRIQKSIFEAIQTINRNLVCMLELQINAHWATRASHFVMLNAHTLRETPADDAANFVNDRPRVV
nr:Putative inner membrane protein [Salmonella sp. NCTC 7297]